MISKKIDCRIWSQKSLKYEKCTGIFIHMCRKFAIL